ncbi:Uncharacterised protein [Klebsiella pneumoniae]|nr:Uncharacterised protein [Klebsiella pneumoniae]
MPASLDSLRTELVTTTLPSDQDYALIALLCNNIMSFLLTLGMPLSECFLWHNRILMNDRNDFVTRFDSWAEKVNVRTQRYTVRLVMENEKFYDMLHQSGEDTIFNGCRYTPFINTKSVRSVKATIEVEAVSVLSAKTGADYILNDSLDVVAYMVSAPSATSCENCPVWQQSRPSILMDTNDEFPDNKRYSLLSFLSA